MSSLPVFKPINSSIKHIALIGMPGVGKSSIGRSLARELNMPFFDSDSSIEETTQMSIPSLFENKGEAIFRHIEHDIIKKLLQTKEKSILSLGGGSIIHPETRKLLEKHAIQVWIRVDTPVLIKRLEKSKSTRPLLQQQNIQQTIERLSIQRMPFYTQANCIVDNSHISKYATTRRIIIALRKDQHIL